MRKCLLKNSYICFLLYFDPHIIWRGGSPCATRDTVDFPNCPQTGLASTSSCHCCRSSLTVYFRLRRGDTSSGQPPNTFALVSLFKLHRVSKSARISSWWPNGLDGVKRSVAGKLFLDIQQESEADSALTDQLIIYSFDLNIQLPTKGWSSTDFRKCFPPQPHMARCPQKHSAKSIFRLSWMYRRTPEALMSGLFVTSPWADNGLLYQIFIDCIAKKKMKQIQVIKKDFSLKFNHSVFMLFFLLYSEFYTRTQAWTRMDTPHSPSHV